MPFTSRAQVLIAWATAPFSGSPSWTDVTDYVRFEKGISMQRGRQDNITDVQAGRLTLTVDNTDGRFTVGRSGSPYAPNVKIGRRIQVNVPDEIGTLHTRFDGLITELPTAWEGQAAYYSDVTIQASDILAWLGRQPPLLSWTQQEMLADAPLALWSLADSSNVTSASDQAGQGAAPLQVVSQGDGTGAAAAGSGVPLAEVQTSGTVAQQQVVQVTTFTTPGAVSWTAPLGTLVSCKAECTAGGQAGTSGSIGGGGAGGTGAEYAAEPALAITMGSTYSGTVGAPGVPSGGSGGDTTFTGDSVTVTAHASGSGSGNTVHFSGGAAGAANGNIGGGGGSSGGQYQAGNAGVAGAAGGLAVTGGGAGGAGDSTGAGGTPGSAPGGAGGGGHHSADSAGGPGGAGQITITLTYIPPPVSQQNSAVSSWLFTPSGTLAARILSGTLPQPVTAAAGFAAGCWAQFAGLPSASVSSFTTPGAITFTAPPGAITADVACTAGGQAGANGGISAGGAGGTGAEYAEEPSLQVTPDSVYSGTVGAPGVPSAGSGGNSTFTGDAATVTANASGSGSANTVHFSGGSGAAANGVSGGGGGASGGQYQAGNPGVSTGGSGGTAVTGGGAGGAGDTSGAGGTPGSAPGGGGGGGHHGTAANSAGGAGGPGQITVTVRPGVSALLTLVQPRGRYAIAVWVTSSGHLQLASTSGYGTRSPSWTTVDAGQVPAAAFHVAVSVAASTRVATLYVNGVSQGTLTLPAGASYQAVTIGGAYGSWLGGWNGSAGLLGVWPAALPGGRVTAHYTAGATGFAAAASKLTAATGSLTSPPATFSLIAQTAVLPAGTYTAAWTVTLAGTTGAPEANNFILNLGPSVFLAASVNASSAGSYPQAQVTFTTPGGLRLLLLSGGAAATSGAVYGGTLSNGTGLSAGTMISKIAGYAGLPSFWYTAPAGTSDPSYGLTLASYYNLAGQQPLAAMQAYELAEGGVLSVNAAGQLVFADRASRYAAGAAASAFTLAAGQYSADTSFKSNDQYLCTEACFATVNIPGGYPVTNAAAESDYGPYTANSGSPPSPQAAPFADATGTAGTYSTDDLMDAGNWAAQVFGQPVSRVPSLTVDLLTIPSAELSTASFYALDIGSAVLLGGLPSQAPDATGQPLAAYHVIEGVNETLDLQDAGRHDVQLYTSPLAQNAAWIPGDALLGVLGSTNTVSRSQAPAALGPPYAPVPTFGATLNRTGSAGAQDWRALTVSTQNKLTPPLLIAQQASAQTLVTAAGQAVTFDTIAADTAAGMGTTSTYTIPAGFTGWWWASAVVQAATGTANLGGLDIWFSVTLSGVNSHWHARNLPYLSSAPYCAAGISGKIGPFSAGDTIQVVTAWSGTATSVPLGTTDGGSMLMLMWEGYT